MFIGASVSSAKMTVGVSECKFIPNSFDASVDRLRIYRKRSTKRTRFSKKEIDRSIIKGIQSAEKSGSYIFEKVDEKNKIINFLRDTSLVRFENQQLFKEMLSELKILKSNSGIPFSKLGISVIMKFFLSVMKLFPLAIPFDFAHFLAIYESVVRPIKNSGAVVVLSEKDASANSWISLGERFMNLWLNLTANDILLQPFGNSMIVSNYFQNKEYFTFSLKNCRRIEHNEFFKVDSIVIDMKVASIFLRIGYEI